MGLGNFFNKLSGNSNSKGVSALCYVFGEDKRYSRRNMESTGVFFQDNDNRVSYNSSPSAIGMFKRIANGMTRILGPVSIVYEPTSHMFSFPALAWSEEEHKEDVILDTAFAEGCALAVQNEDREEWMNRLMTILLLAVMGAVVLLLLLAAQSGILSGLFSKLPGFFGG